MLPNNNPPNFPPVAPAGLMMPQGYVTPHSTGITQMMPMVYPMVPGQQQAFVSPVTAQFYQQQRAYMPHMVAQNVRPRAAADQPPAGHRSSEFTAQQQKLKAFGVKGAKATAVSVDNMIENMFGKAPQKVERKTPSSAALEVKTEVVSRPEPPPSPNLVHIPEPSASLKKQAPVKSLETMMQECTNLTVAGGTHKKSFGKGNVPHTVQRRGTTPAPVQPPARFPSWCCATSVPPLYLQVENFIRVEGSPADSCQYDNARLLPVLMSSGLQKEHLARLWEAVSLTQPGALTQKELYAILALVALCQAGYQVTGPEVLLMLGTPPLPALALPNPVPQSGEVPCPPAETVPLHPPENVLVQPPEPVLVPVGPSEPRLTDEAALSAPGPVSNPAPGSEDDEFDDFKQATWNEPTTTASASVPSPAPEHVITGPTIPTNTAQKDKYAAFLEIESQFQSETEEPTPVSQNSHDDFGDFLSADFSLAPTAQPETATLTTSSLSFWTEPTTGIINPTLGSPLVSFSIPSTIPDQSINQPFKANFDGFGASIFGTDESKPSSAENFADFESQSQGAFATSPTNEDSTEDEFTLFSQSCLSPVSDTRLAETQSVASLELTTNMEQFSHHGSSHSLDSKAGLGTLSTASLEDGPKHHQRSVSDGQGLVVKALASMSLEPSESSISLVDRYSSICNERTKVGVSCIQELGRCLSSCLKLIEAGANIFQQMSSTNVFHEVLAAKEVLDYIQNIKEVYTVTQRIRAATAVACCPTDLQETLRKIQAAWDSLVNIILSSPHPCTPSDLRSPCLEFSSAVLSANEVSRASCGICLLDVDDSSATCWTDSVSALVKLSYSRRQYHATCANLWLNCVDPILPAFTLQELYSQ